MANSNSFNRFTKENLSDSSSSPSTVYTVNANETSIITGCLISNKLSQPADVTVELSTTISGSDSVKLVSGIEVPAFSAIELGLGKVVLKNDGNGTDSIRAFSNQTDALDITLSILQNVKQ